LFIARPGILPANALTLLLHFVNSISSGLAYFYMPMSFAQYCAMIN